jgi:NADH-quinone oxidoreductase subunit F
MYFLQNWYEKNAGNTRKNNAGKSSPEDLDTLEDLARKVSSTSLCGLGQTAPNPVLTTLQYFRDEYEAHIINKKCPAGQCTALINYRIIEDKCVGCGLCKRVCPANAISGKTRELHEINSDICVKCGKCFEVCKFKAVVID